MAAQRSIDQLVEHGVFEQTADDRLTLTQPFIEAVERHRDRLEAADADEIETAIKRVTLDEETAVRLCENTAYDPDVLSRVIALREVDESATLGQTLLLAVVTDQLATGVPPDEGAPEGFVPVTGSGLTTLVSTCERCLVYVWREECEPCETVSKALTELVTGGGGTAAVPLAVYGPDDVSVLRRNYDVVGAPTVFSTVDGVVDTAITGPASKSKLTAELGAFGES